MWKIKHCLSGLYLILLSCTSSPVKEPARPDEKALIDQVKPLVREFIAASERADKKAATAPYWDSPHFSLVSNGLLLTYSDLVKGNTEYFNFIKSQKFSTREEKYLLLSDEIVLVNWSGKVEAQQRDGKTFTADPITISLLFKKVDNTQWKVVYTNESTPIHIPAAPQ